MVMVILRLVAGKKTHPFDNLRYHWSFKGLHVPPPILSRPLLQALPNRLLLHAEAKLAAGERTVARLMTDLDSALHFRHGLIVLTNARLLHFEDARSGQPS